jgi:hypothetical protein
MLSPPPPPVSITYECLGNLKAYARRLVYDGATPAPDGKPAGFSVTAYPKTENSELAILNAKGAPEFLIHPAMVECGCFLDDQVFVTHFSSQGPRHFTQAPGQFRFELEDGSGSLECRIALYLPAQLP